MTLPALLIPIFMAAATPVVDTAAIAAPAATSPAAVTAEQGTPPPAQPAKLEFPLAGYRINALDSARKGDFILTMFLPVPKNTFSAFSFKVDITILTPKDGIASWQNQIKENRSYFTESGNAILQDRSPSPTEWLLEATTMGKDKAGPKGRLYERMVYANGKLYSIIATAPEAQWKDAGPKLKACVDSFDPSGDPVPGKVSYPQQGFRISVLDGAAPADAKQTLLRQPLPMGLLGVTIEPYTKTLEDYRAGRKPPFLSDAKHSFKILAETSPTENALVTEFAEVFPPAKNLPQGGQLVSFEKVVLAHGQLYRVSAYQPQVDNPDPQTTAQIKAWVESLESMPAPAPVP